MTKPVRRVSVLADALLRQLQAEAEQTRHFPPADDEPRVPNPLDSAQARRAAGVLL